MVWAEHSIEKQVFLVLLGLSDGFRWFLEFGRGTLELVELWQYMPLKITWLHVYYTLYYVTGSKKCTQTSKIIPYHRVFTSAKNHYFFLLSFERFRHAHATWWCCARCQSLFGRVEVEVQKIWYHGTTWLLYDIRYGRYTCWLCEIETNFTTFWAEDHTFSFS